MGAAKSTSYLKFKLELRLVISLMFFQLDSTLSCAFKKTSSNTTIVSKLRVSEKELIKELVDAGREGKKDKEFLKNHIDETFAANEKKQSRV